MSKEFNNIDDLFKSTFEADLVEVPDFIKSNIDNKLRFNHSKKRIFWWLGLGAVILLIGSVFVFTLFDETSSSKMNNELSYTESPNNSAELNKQRDGAHTNINSSESISNENNDAENAIVENEVSQSNTSNKNLVDKKNSSTGTSTIADANGSDGKNNNNSENDGKNGDTNSGMNNHDENFDNNTYSTNLSQKFVADKEKPNFCKASPAGLIAYQPNHLALGTSVHADSVLKIKNYFTPISDLNPLEAKVKINRDAPYNPWMYTFTGGANFAKSFYVSSNLSEEHLYANSTKDKPSFGLDFEAKYRLKSGLTFATGLGLEQLVENYQFIKNTYTLDSTLTWSYEYDSLDTTGTWPPIDSSYTATYDTTTASIYNAEGQTRANYIHIPISFGTQIIYHKFRFDLFGTARFNYLVSASGGYIVNDTFISFTKKTNPIFKPWYFDVVLGATIHYQLTNKLFVSGTVRYKPPFGQLYQNTSFNRSLSYTHVGVGLSIKL